MRKLGVVHICPGTQNCMDKKVLLSVLPIALMVILFLGLGSTNATSVAASFNAVNASVQMNQNIFFNISAFFSQNVSYAIYLNNSLVSSGTIPANFEGYMLVRYNVSDTLYGTYPSYVKLSTLSSPIKSDTNTTIQPRPSFGLSGISNYTYIFNNTAHIPLNVENNGNTPLGISWALPTASGVLFALNYQQAFNLAPGQVFSIPINITLSKPYQPLLNFSFVAGFNGQTIRKSFITTLFSPVINLSFSKPRISSQTANTTIFYAEINNGDNVPVNATFQFVLNSAGNVFLFNKSVMISPSATNVSILLPKSYVEKVSVFYSGGNGKSVSNVVFYKPLASGSPIQQLLINNLPYLMVTAIALAAVAILHHKVSKERRKTP